MWDQSRVKFRIEALNIAYLCANFGVKRANPKLSGNGLEFDLVAGKSSLFELKSRTFPRLESARTRETKDGTLRKRYKSEFEWWALDADQIAAYSNWCSENDYTPYWIFLLGETNRRVTDHVILGENSILNREVYVLPWETHRLVNISPNGSYHNIGLKRLKNNYGFKTKTIPKGTIHIEESIEKAVKRYFA